MAQTLAQITKQIEKLQKEADALRQTELKGVVDRIKVAIAHYGLTPDQLGFGKAAVKSAKSAKSTKKISPNAAKPQFANNEGQVWSGRGPRPLWLREALAAGRSLDEFRTAAQNRAPKGDLASKQSKPSADVVAPAKANLAAKRTKASIKKVSVGIDSVPASGETASANATATNSKPAKVKRRAKAALAKPQRAVKTSATKTSSTALKKALRPKTTRLKAVSAAAHKVATAANAEKTVAAVPASVEA